MLLRFAARTGTAHATHRYPSARHHCRLNAVFHLSTESHHVDRFILPQDHRALLSPGSGIAVGRPRRPDQPTRTDAGAESIRSLLWVGNSFFYYNNSMHGHFDELARAAEPTAGIAASR